MAERKKLGEMLMEAKIISAVQLQSAMAHQKQWGGRIGSAMIEKGFITEDILAKFLSLQLNVPSVTLSKLKITMDVLQRVPRDLQEKHSVVPIAVLKEGKRESLILAMADPTDVHAIDEIGFATGLKVKPVVATEGAIKKYLQGGTHGSSYRERSVEREIALPDPVRGTGPVGEAELVLDSEPSISSELIMGNLDEPPIARGTIEPPPAPVAPPVAPKNADPFAAAVLARSSAPPTIVRTSPAPMGNAAPAFVPAAPPVVTPLPEIPAEPLPEVSLDPFSVIPGSFDSEDRTEVDIPAATGPAPATAAPAGPVVSIEPDPPTATRPSFEPPVEEAWDTQPGMTPENSAIGAPAAPLSAPPIIARGALMTDEPADEISLPGPEPLAPPADLLVDAPSKSFAIPTDLEIAEPTVLDSEPPPMAIGQVMPAPEAPADFSIPAESGFAPMEETAFGEPAALAEAPPAATLAAPEAPAAFEPAPESFEPAPESFEPAPETFAPAPEELAPAAESFAPAAESFEPAPESFAPAPDAPFSVEDPASAWQPELEQPAQEPPASETPAFAAPEWGVAAEPPAEEQPAPAAPLSTEAGAVPVMTTMVDHADEGTVLNAGAFEPTWSGDASQLAGGDDLAYATGAPVPAHSENDIPTKTREAVLPPPVAERATTRPTPPPRAPSGTVVNEPPPAPVAQLERTGSTELRPELTPEPSREPTPSPVAAKSPISEEQAALNQTITKKLKLLNAIAELLLEKGLITEDEIKEKISKKRS